MLNNSIRRVTSLAAAGLTAATLTTALGATAGADPADGPAVDPIVANNALLANPVSDDGSKIASADIEGQTITLQVYSAAMDKNITVPVQRPADTSVPRPTLYLLNGAGGGEDTATFIHNTQVMPFLAQKDVNVVSPIGGRWAYYTDWENDDPVLGRNKWKTFLLDELPPLIDAALGTNGQQSIDAISMTGTSVLQLAEARPGFYNGVGSLSGCAQTSDPTGKQFMRMVVEVYGGGKLENMYGPDGDPAWQDNDPYIHADLLRGTQLFIASGTGLPGSHDQAGDPFMMSPGSVGVGNQIIVGGIIEAATNYCSHNLQNRLNDLGIPATYDFHATGTHSWGYFNDEFYSSWPTMAASLGIDA